MNLFNKHDQPEILHGHDKKHLTTPFVYDAVREDHSLIGNKDIEAVIAQDSLYSYRYAMNVIRKPFPLGEQAIAESGEYSFYYAKYVLKDRFPLGEKAILNYANAGTRAGAITAYDYASQVIKAPWTEAEKIIAKDKVAAWSYHQRFPERKEAIEKLQRDMS